VDYTVPKNFQHLNSDNRRRETWTVEQMKASTGVMSQQHSGDFAVSISQNLQRQTATTDRLDNFLATGLLKDI